MPANIEAFIHRKVIVLRENAHAEQAARAMCDNRVGCVVVADESGHRLVGIVTDRDLVCGLLAVGLGGDAPLGEIMTPDPVLVDESARLADVIAAMESGGIRRVPVVHTAKDGRQRCVGIVTLDDLIAARTVEYQRLAQVVKSQIFRRRGAHSPEVRKELASQRSEAHMEQTLGKFTHAIAHRVGLGEQQARAASVFTLGLIVRRLHCTGAAHLIVQLPRLLQDELLDLPAGPERSITLERMVVGLAQRFGFTVERSRAILFGICAALADLVDPAELDHVRSQLPFEMQGLFPTRPKIGKAS